MSTCPTGYYTPASLRRQLARWAHRQVAPEEEPGLDKPCWDSPADMYDPDVLGVGRAPLPRSELRLLVENWDRMHRCDDCAAGRPCYWDGMRLLLSHGYRLVLREDDEEGAGEEGEGRVARRRSRRRGRRSRQRWRKNHPGCERFATVVQTSVDEMVAAGVLVPAAPDRLENVAPLLCVLRPSDVRKVKALSGIDLVDGEAMRAYEAWRAEHPEAKAPKVKVRVAIDLSSAGTNDALVSMPFSMPTWDDVGALLTPGAWCRTGDLRSAFHHYAMAEEPRPKLGIRDMRGAFWQFTKLPFGLRTAPLLACLYAAEVTAMARARGIRCVLYVDDVIVIGTDRDDCEQQ